MDGYRILMHERAYQKATDYLGTLRKGRAQAGAFLRMNLNERDLDYLTVPAFVEELVNSKRPRIFAESGVFGDGRDWNLVELSLLGDIAVAVPVKVYDNGLHQNPAIHDVPFQATLFYVPGALLRNDSGNEAADWDEVTQNGAINRLAYAGLYERRLLPALFNANDTAGKMKQQALITIPGLGCGLFAGPFKGKLGTVLGETIGSLLDEYGRHLQHIRAVYYDPYREGDNDRQEFGHISYFVRPLTRGNEDKPQLCAPTVYEDEGDDFAGCHLFSFVAWDHVSWPGNDFYVGSRLTDDGVKAAATSSMAIVTGLEGSYNEQSFKYEPPHGYRNWLDVVDRRHCQLKVQNNLSVLRYEGQDLVLEHQSKAVE